MLQVVASVAEHNRMAQMLQLIPSTAANAAGFDYEMKPDLTQAEGIRVETSIMVCCVEFVFGVVIVMNVYFFLTVALPLLKNDAGGILYSGLFQCLRKHVQQLKNISHVFRILKKVKNVV